ncbi:CheY chemotaxis protein or a CheY-like REC (receiver) domain [Salinihabitans flavidus]|uniref:CheY chemotaxis protein or a CheY-like REC (Receiver) domain n=1 Tax=Salinihabitans flavidus TaxID=569882 RepID=A0A1H8NLX1_9RHOB|nr:hypothetical protein [Salinihabitans flavidus]SEO30566.1 CheY chemotaxis protein or a CheY-like REC (receiver) domain [Salinihabitans flavidus]
MLAPKWRLNRSEKASGSALRENKWDQTTPTRPGPALVGIFASLPVAVLSLVGLLVAGLPLGWSLLITIGLQYATAAIVIGVCSKRAKDRRHPAGPGTSPVSIKATAADLRAPLEAHVWQHYAAIPGSEPPRHRIAFAAPNAEHSRTIAKDLSEIGAETHLVSDIEALLETVLNAPDAWDFVITDLDVTGDSWIAVDEMMYFRKICPQVPVLLLTSKVSRDDFSTIKCAIGDVTLRKPVHHRRLMEGLKVLIDDTVTREQINLSRDRDRRFDS